MTQSVYHHASVPAWHSAPATYTPFTDYLNLDHYNLNAPSAVVDHVVPDDDRRYSPSASPSSPSRALNHHGFEATSWESSTYLYRFSAARPSQSPLTSPEPDPDAAQVKQEEEQDDFVFENPPTTDANVLVTNNYVATLPKPPTVQGYTTAKSYIVYKNGSNYYLMTTAGATGVTNQTACQRIIKAATGQAGTCGDFMRRRLTRRPSIATRVCVR